MSQTEHNNTEHNNNNTSTPPGTGGGSWGTPPGSLPAGAELLGTSTLTADHTMDTEHTMNDFCTVSNQFVELCEKVGTSTDDDAVPSNEMVSPGISPWRHEEMLPIDKADEKEVDEKADLSSKYPIQVKVSQPISTTSNSKKDEPMEYVSTTLLKITPEQIGMFVGAKGVFLKKYIFGPTIRECTGSKVRCNIVENKGVVEAHLSANSNEALDILLKCIRKHQDITISKSVKSTVNPTTKRVSNGLTLYAFKTKIPQSKTGDFIGRQGRNVKQLEHKISQVSEIASANVNISISPDRYVNPKNCYFHIMDDLEWACPASWGGCCPGQAPGMSLIFGSCGEKRPGEDCEGGDIPYSIITVRVYTTQRRAVWESVHKILTENLTMISKFDDGTRVYSNYLDQSPTEVILDT